MSVHDQANAHMLQEGVRRMNLDELRDMEKAME